MKILDTKHDYFYYECDWCRHARSFIVAPDQPGIPRKYLYCSKRNVDVERKWLCKDYKKR